MHLSAISHNNTGPSRSDFQWPDAVTVPLDELLQRLCLLLRRLIDTPERIQASGISDIRNTLADHIDEELFVVADTHISRRMRRQLRFAASLCRQEAKRNHFPLSVIQPGSRILITEAVVRQPFVDMSGFLRTALVESAHSLSENIHLHLVSFLQAVFRCCLRLIFQRK